MRRMAIWAIGVMALAAPVFGAAATLDTTTEKLATGADAVDPCDGDGFTESYVTSGGNVRTVTIAGIADPACEGGRLSLTVTNAANAAIASAQATVPSDADSLNNTMILTVSPNPFAGNVAGLHVSIVGP